MLVAVGTALAIGLITMAMLFLMRKVKESRNDRVMATADTNQPGQRVETNENTSRKPRNRLEMMRRQRQQREAAAGGGGGGGEC